MHVERLKAGLIAAGDGQRLGTSHPGIPKPLVPIAGVPLCHWVVNSLRKAGISDFTVLLNSRASEVRKSLKAAFPTLHWNFLEADTGSSWESFRLVCREMTGESEFIISTIDALMPTKEISRFISEAHLAGAESALALTEFVNDEKPLWADIDTGGIITALGPDARVHRYITSGLYSMTQSQARRLPEAKDHGKLREYWMAELSRKTKIAGIPLAKSLDVDRPEDVEEAEKFVIEASLS